MKYKYTKEQDDFVMKLVKDPVNPMRVTPATKEMCKHFNITYTEGIGRTFRHKMQTKGVTKNAVRIEDSKEFKKAAKKVFDKRRKKFAIGWAQNNTPVNQRVLDAMLAYAAYHKAGVHIIAGRYKNPTSIWTFGQQNEEHWDRAVLPYLDANRHNLHKFLQVLSDIKMQPTASTPLSGMNGITGLESCVIGHPRMHLKSLPVLDGYPSKLLVSTGALTELNYTDSGAGKKGEFHHQLGFVFVELDGDNFHIRQISVEEDGTFYDLCYKVVDGVVYKNEEGAEAIVLGDIHNLSTDPVAMGVSSKMLDYFKPNHTLVHDLQDAKEVNPHESKNPFLMLEKEEGALTLKGEMDAMIDWLHRYKQHNLVVVRSNHDEFVDRFLLEDWRKQTNKLMYLKYASAVAEGLAPKGIVPYIIDKEFGGEVKALGIDDSYRVLDWELGVHGHIGANGSRGSANQFKNLNTKNVTGHTHAPIRLDGHASVGTLTFKRLTYNKGMSSWMQSNFIIYPNGKGHHVHIIGGKYTTFDMKH